MKRIITIERLVRWAYCEELPKAARDAGPLGPAAFGPSIDARQQPAWACGGLIDEPNRWGVMPDHSAHDEPHPDALRVGEAVMALTPDCLPEMMAGRCAVFSREEYGAAGEPCRALLDKAQARAWAACSGPDGQRFAGSIPALIVRNAVLGVEDCTFDVPRLEHERAANGRDRWFVQRRHVIDGVVVNREEKGTDSRGRPVAGAYRKPYLDPDPWPCALARIRYWAWNCAIKHLARVLEHRLAEHELPPRTQWGAFPDWRPWEKAAPAVLTAAQA